MKFQRQSNNSEDFTLLHKKLSGLVDFNDASVKQYLTLHLYSAPAIEEIYTRKLKMVID